MSQSEKSCGCATTQRWGEPPDPEDLATAVWPGLRTELKNAGQKPCRCPRCGGVASDTQDPNGPRRAPAAPHSPEVELVRAELAALRSRPESPTRGRDGPTQARGPAPRRARRSVRPVARSRSLILPPADGRPRLFGTPVPALTLPGNEVPVYVPVVPDVDEPEIECSETFKPPFGQEIVEKKVLLQDAYHAAARWTYWAKILLQTIQGVASSKRESLWNDSGGEFPGNAEIEKFLSVAADHWFGEYSQSNLDKVEYRVRRMWETRFYDPGVKMKIHCEEPGYQGSACACSKTHFTGAVHTLFMQPCFCDRYFDHVGSLWGGADWGGLVLSREEDAGITLVHELFHHVDWKLIDFHTCTKIQLLGKKWYQKDDCLDLASKCPWEARTNVSSYAYFVANVGILVDRGLLTWPRFGLPGGGGGGGGGSAKDCTQTSDDPVSECIQVFPGYDP